MLFLEIWHSLSKLLYNLDGELETLLKQKVAKKM